MAIRKYKEQKRLDFYGIQDNVMREERYVRIREVLWKMVPVLVDKVVDLWPNEER